MPSTVRWLTRRKVAEVIKNSLPALINAMQEGAALAGAEDRAEIEGLLYVITSFQFMATTSFMCDALEPTTVMSKRQQLKGIPFAEQMILYRHAVNALSDLRDSLDSQNADASSCPTLALFMSELQTGKTTEFMRELTDVEQGQANIVVGGLLVDLYSCVAKPYTEAIIRHLKAAFDCDVNAQISEVVAVEHILLASSLRYTEEELDAVLPPFTQPAIERHVRNVGKVAILLKLQHAPLLCVQNLGIGHPFVRRCNLHATCRAVT